MVLLLASSVPEIDVVLFASDIALFVLKSRVDCAGLVLIELILAVLER